MREIGKLFCQRAYLAVSKSHPAREVSGVENAAALCSCRLQLDIPHWHTVYEDNGKTIIDWDHYEKDVS